MKTHEALKLKSENKYQARTIKAGIFLRYSLLLDLMTIVKKHGRKPDYDFGNDQNMAKILEGSFGTEGKSNKNHVTCAFDSFLTIWLLTLPEKFKKWYEYHNSDSRPRVEGTTMMDINESPKFPVF